MRVALTTGGGDAPGLNAVIRAAVLSALARGWEVVGIQRGYGGLIGDDEIVSLTRDSVRGITHRGGTILGATNRGNPFRWPVLGGIARTEYLDRSDELVAAIRERDIDALVAIGGDGSLEIALGLFEKGVAVVGVPKTIDNDVGGTIRSFGFDTAVTIATEALDRLHSTAEAHDRVFVVELMGRNAGWIALYAGIAGSADVVLIPEIPFAIERVCEKIRERERIGRRFSIVVAAEGAAPCGGSQSFVAPAEGRLGGIAHELARAIADETGKETRAVVLGHLQRGGTPTTHDRELALRFGAAAIRAVADRAFGTMVAWHPPDIVRVPLEHVVHEAHRVPVDGDTVATARDLGICLGD
jgi:6-phosphofructokinase 1